ncbi:hypothetical protein H206_03396 [Candidatus Electrothrix aarhusensis]|uniref:Uncharacterized protein n=1 Tax=Candidatus Electrothrix aarhusensis TaxID=1859131 RepID=A0A444IPX4_9BACT|nr:hypothetical protein H206_03396 [Candidatus Electrothrix aarhusensis]
MDYAEGRCYKPDPSRIAQANRVVLPGSWAILLLSRAVPLSPATRHVVQGVRMAAVKKYTGLRFNFAL